MIWILLFLLLLALMGAPLFVCLGAAGLTLAWFADLPSAVLIVELYRIATSPNLLAIPLFTLAGVILAEGGAAKRLVSCCQTFLGRLPGGLAIVSIVTCAFFTAFSGASGITILAIGGLLYPMLKSEQYSERFSLGLLTTSGSLGILFPPSLAILLYGVIAGVSIEELFLAGVVPGIILMIMLAAYSMFVNRNIPAAPSKHSQHVKGSRRRALRAAIWDLLLPFFIITGVFGGIVTVTEAAACTAAYAILLETIIHRELRAQAQFEKIVLETSILSGSILIIVAIAMTLNSQLIDAQVPMKLLAMMESLVESQLGFLILLNIFLLLIGCIMDLFSAIVIVTPLVLPIAARYGVDPVHLGILFLANLEIGYSTPPVGLNLFIASQRFKKPIFTLFRATLPFLAITLAWLMLVTYVPELTLWWK